MQQIRSLIKNVLLKTQRKKQTKNQVNETHTETQLIYEKDVRPNGKKSVFAEDFWSDWNKLRESDDDDVDKQHYSFSEFHPRFCVIQTSSNSSSSRGTSEGFERSARNWINKWFVCNFICIFSPVLCSFAIL